MRGTFDGWIHLKGMHTSLIAVVMLASMFVLAAGVLLLADRLGEWRHRDRRTAAQRGADDSALRHRLLNPRWQEVQQATGGRPSSALRTLYSDSDLIVQTEFVVPLHSTNDDALSQEQIACFQPADGQTLLDPWRAYLPKAAFPFARDFTGDLVFVELTPDGDDLPVKHWFHDGDDVELVAPSLAEFHRWCVAAMKPRQT